MKLKALYLDNTVQNSDISIAAIHHITENKNLGFRTQNNNTVAKMLEEGDSSPKKQLTPSKNDLSKIKTEKPKFTIQKDTKKKS